MSRPHINQLVKLDHTNCVEADLRGLVGYVAEVSEDFLRARVQTITPQAHPGRSVWVDAAALLAVDDPRWRTTFAEYQRRIDALLRRRLWGRVDAVAQIGKAYGLTIDQFLTLLRQIIETSDRLPVDGEEP